MTGYTGEIVIIIDESNHINLYITLTLFCKSVNCPNLSGSQLV